MLVREIINEKIKYTVSSKDNRNVWVIGDVHGCAVEFEDILSRIRLEDSNARIIQLGDLIDRGPFFTKIFDLCDEYNVETIIGNHEYNFWLESLEIKECRSKSRKISHDIFKNLPLKKKEHILERIARSSNFLFCESKFNNKTYLLSHAPLHKQPLNFNASAQHWCMTTEQKTPCEMSFNIHGHAHWDYTNIKTQLEDTKKTCYNIDSGLVYGGELTALCLSDFSYIQIKSKQTYWKEYPKL